MRWLGYVVICAALCGCARTVYVPTETVRTEARADTVRLVSARTDSVYVRDSVYLETDAATAETVRVRERWLCRYVTSADTVWRARTDTVYAERTVTVTVPGESGRNRWRALAIGSAAAALALLALILAKNKR